MTSKPEIRETPWDKAAFGMNTYELTQLNGDVIQFMLQNPGHYTIRVSPLESKQLLHLNGFYYADTLIEPYCDRDKFKPAAPILGTKLISPVKVDEVIGFINGSFLHSRFQRDFNLNQEQIDHRYSQWLAELIQTGTVYGLSHQDVLIGFFASKNEKIILHGIERTYQGKGLAKVFWSAACRKLFEQGYPELSSSISAANLAAINLYAGLGFRFRKPVDLYHRIVSN